MSALVHTVLLVGAVVLAHLWLSIPFLEGYSLQVFALSIFLYLVIKRLSKAKLWHLAPSAASIEMPVVTFAFMLLIGSTGNLGSLFFSLTYIHLFFLIMASEVSTAITTTMAIVLFHYAMTQEFSTHDISVLLSVPVIMVFFLFTRYQYQEVIRGYKVIKEEEKQLKSTLKEEYHLLGFIERFLIPKLTLLEQLAESPFENQAALSGQLRLVMYELNKVLSKIKGPKS